MNKRKTIAIILLALSISDLVLWHYDIIDGYSCFSVWLLITVIQGITFFKID